MANRTFSDVKINVTYTPVTADNHATTDPSYVVVSGGNDHASNISSPQDLAKAFGKIQNWYSNWHSVVWTGDASSVSGYTVATNVPSGALFTDEKVKQSLASANKNYPILFSYYETSDSTATPNAQTVNRVNTIYINPSTGTVTATNFVGTINGYTISGNVAKAVPSNAVFTDTTYTFTGGVSGAYFQVTPSGGSAQTVYINGLGTMAFEAAADYITTKPDGTHDLFDSSHVINSEYLPSYVDDVIEVIYDSATGKIYDPASPSTELTPETGKIYVDVSVPTKSDGPSYRWSGTAFISLKSPTVDGVADVVAGTNNGEITVSYNDGSTPSTVTVYTPEGNFIPSGGSVGQFLGYGGSSGTAVWTNIPSVSVFTGAPDASHAGTSGIVPAPAASTYDATKNRHYLRSDAQWSDEPVTADDILTLNVVAAT